MAESTMAAVMGRTSAYTGKAITWDEIMKSEVDTFPKKLEWGPYPEPAVPRPGVSDLI